MERELQLALIRMITDNPKLNNDFSYKEPFDLTVTLNGVEVDFAKLFYMFNEIDDDYIDRLVKRRLDETVGERFAQMDALLKDMEDKIRSEFGIHWGWEDND
jgi:hypothetical protein